MYFFKTFKLANGFIKHWHYFATLVFFITTLSACSAYNPFFSSRKVAYGLLAGVVTEHPLATKTARYVLLSGGNAIDATVAASFVLAVVRPHSTGIGGGGFLMYHDQIEGKNYAFDFRERAPLKLTSELIEQQSCRKETTTTHKNCKLLNPIRDGHLAVGVPGLVKGLSYVHDRFGRLPFEALLRPAIYLAESGFIVYDSLIDAVKNRQATLSRFPASRKLLLNEGMPIKKDSLFIQRDLANTLRRIARYGAKDFYQGTIAEAITSDMLQNDGVLTLKDLRSFKVINRQPLKYHYKDLTFYFMPPPSAGGVLLKELLIMTELLQKRVKLTSLGWNSDGLGEHYISEIMKRAFFDRANFLGDPANMLVSPNSLTRRVTLQEWTEKLNPIHTVPLSAHLIDHNIYESPSTTHISIIDKDGNAVSSTQTINVNFGSGVVVPNTGIILNNQMDDFSIGTKNSFQLDTSTIVNRIEGGKTPLSSMTPLLVVKDNQVQLAIGAPGGPRIISSIYLTLYHYLFRDKTLSESIFLPRLHHQWSPDLLYLESKSQKIINNLQSKGHQIGKSEFYFGAVEAVERLPDNTITAVSDYRSDGIAWANN
jgi:gamma-glutamyltranspeptidase/glutathione hydrolase